MLKNERCARCERLPPSVGGGSLYLWLPTAHTHRKLIVTLQREGWAVSHHEQANALRIDIGERAFEALTVLLHRQLIEAERRDSRALLLPAGEELSFQHFSQISSMDEALNLIAGHWLVELLREERLTSWFQPIVSAQDPSKVIAHEALMRAHGADGQLIFPGQLIQAAHNARLIFQLDLAARKAAVRAAAREGLQGQLFINFSPASIYDPIFCLRSTFKTIEENGIAPERIVFEVTEAEHAGDVNHLRRILETYRAAGLRVALDDVGAGYSSLNLLHELRPDIIKLDMAMVRGVTHDAFKARISSALLDIARDLQIETVAEGIEDEETLEWFQERGVTYAQGYLFARPAPQPITGLHLERRAS